jgi:signal transduction histidine kinase/CheY-like chemotaxis protein
VKLDQVRSSIGLKTTLVVMGVALGIGLVAGAVMGRVAERYEARRSLREIAGLLAVVEPSASAACAAGDRHLAQETAQGLLNSPSIARVEIRGGGSVLAKAQRSGSKPAGVEVMRPVPAPLAGDQVVGEVRVFPDAEETARSVARYLPALRGLVLLMALVVGTALTLTVMRTVIRPVKQLSDQLGRPDSYRGLRLDPPLGHEADEIGSLVVEVNRALAGVERQHRLQQQVKDAHAQKINSLGSLAGGVAHDFNNMLAGIMAYADLLLEEEAEPRRQKYLRNILGAAARSGELTAKLLAFGRRGKNRVESVSLETVVQDCLAILKPSMHPDLQVISSLEEGLCVDGDPAQVQQVLMNLCINAIEAMPGPGTLRLSVRSIQIEEAKAALKGLVPGSFVRVQISDTGPGISPEFLSQIFEPFFTTKTKKGEMGTGLGLSTVYGIVEAHHGAIEVASTVGRGSSFRVLLPLGRLGSTPAGPGRKLTSGKGTVLVVEDEPILRDAAQNALNALGYAVVTAEHGRAGVEAYQERHGDLLAVLLDLKMPVMGGRDAFFRMRTIDASVPVIICTGYSENEEIQELLKSGAVALLPKPYRIHELAEILQGFQSTS